MSPGYNDRVLVGIAAALNAEGLRPIIDPDLRLVRAECPDCRAGETDPEQIWRPIAIIPRGVRVLARCDACEGGADV